VISVVVFDLDGILVDSEQVWDDARRALAAERGINWPAEATHAMIGMSSPEWSRYMHEAVGLPEPREAINGEVVAWMERLYRAELPVIDGAPAAVRRMGEAFRLGLASSSNRPIIELVLELTGLGDAFEATVSSEEVARGKPAPDVYLEALRRLGVSGSEAAAVEDSHSGIRSAHAAGMRVVAIPNPHFPPDAEALALADTVLDSIVELSTEVVRAGTVAP
jgi:beta-phosphoglucomutase-like phosphatase (HAD superfamily)